MTDEELEAALLVMGVVKDNYFSNRKLLAYRSVHSNGLIYWRTRTATPSNEDLFFILRDKVRILNM